MASAGSEGAVQGSGEPVWQIEISAPGQARLFAPQPVPKLVPKMEMTAD